MKRIHFLFAIMLLLSILSSCKSVPQGVQDNINTYEIQPSGEQVAQNSPDYDTLENIIANTPANMNVRIGNVLFDGIIRVPETDTLSELMHRNEIYPFLLPENNIYDENLIVDVVKQDIAAGIVDPIGQSWGIEYYMNDITSISIAEDGFLVTVPYTAKKSEENLGGYFESSFFPVEKIIQCYRGEPLNDDLLPVRNGEMSMIKAAQEVLDFLNTNPWRQWEEGYSYMIRTVFVRKVDDVYGYEFCIERLYKGVTLDATPFYEFYEDDPADLERKGNVRRKGSPIYIMISSLDGPSDWNIRTENSYTVINENPLPDHFITFDAALEAACGAISRSANITIRSAELCYDVGYRGFMSIYEERGVKEFYSNPVWAFKIDQRGIGVMENGHDPHWTIFVNAVSGEVYVYDNPPGY